MRTSVCILLLALATHAQDPIADVLAAIDDAEALATIALRFDAWAISDQLYYRGNHDAAEALARAVKGPDGAALPAYLAQRRKSPPPTAVIEALAQPRIATLEGVRDEGDDYYRARVHEALAKQYLAAGRFAESAAAWRNSAEFARAIGWLWGAANALHWAGRAYRGEFRFTDMIDVWNEREELERRRGHELLVAMTRRNIGSVYGEIADYGNALRYYESAREVLAKYPQEHAGLVSNIGLVHHRRGDFRTALQTYERALEIARQSNGRVQEAVVLLWMSVTLLDLGDYAASVKHLDGARTAFAALKIDRGVGEALGNLGLVYETQERYGEALEHYTESLEIFERIRDERNALIAMSNVGVALRGLEKHADARAHQEDALKRAQAVGDPYLLCEILRELGESLAAGGDHAAALARLGEASAIAEQLDSESLLFDVQSAMAEVQLQADDAAGAVRVSHEAVAHIGGMIRGLGVGQGAKARAAHHKTYTVGLRGAVQLGAVDEFCFFAESGRAGALLESLEGRDAIRAAAIPDELRAQEEGARQAVGMASVAYEGAVRSGKRKAIGERRDELKAARAKVTAIVERIQREARGGDILYPRAADLKALRGSLRRGDTLVVYADLDTEAAALVVTTHDARIVKLAPIGKLDVDLDDLTSLRKAVVDPLRLTRMTKRVLVSPDGALFRVPFAALMPYAVAFTPSGTTYGHLLKQASMRGEGVLAVGDPAYERLARLPGTRDEAKAVGDVVLLGTKATKDAFLGKVKERGRWRSIHLACHGTIDAERPMFSSLALTKSELTALDVFQTPIPADLVVLSACESGRGTVYRGEGMVGLTRAFMFAGAPRVIVSLWKVDDAATRALMTKFYAQWKQGMGTAAALRAAQNHIRSQRKWAHPEYWAAWVLWGLAD